MRYLPSILAALAAATTYADPLELSTHSTIYTSDQSAASSMFDIKAKTDIVVYGLDVNLATQSEQEVLVYTKSGSFQRFENDESAWKLVLNSTVVGQGADVPTSLLMEGWDPVVVPANTKQAFMVMLNDAYVRYSDFAQGDRLYYINHDLIIYGKGCAKRKGWDGGLISPRVFNGGVRYVTGNETVEVLSGNIVGLPTVSPTVVSSCSSCFDSCELELYCNHINHLTDSTTMHIISSLQFQPYLLATRQWQVPVTNPPHCHHYHLPQVLLLPPFPLSVQPLQPHPPRVPHAGRPNSPHSHHKSTPRPSSPHSSRK